MTYKLYKTTDGVDAALKTNQDGSHTSFLFDPANRDYIEYLKWLEEGHQPLPAEEQQ